MSRRRGTKGRPLGEVVLDAAIITLGVVIAALLVSTLVRAIVPGPSGVLTRSGLAEARLGGAERMRVSADGGPGPAGSPGAGGTGRGMESPPQRPAQEIRIQVLNGCGVNGAGRKLASVLRLARGFDVIDIANADSFDFEQTVVIDRVGDGVAAGRVARVLGDPPIVKQRQSDRSFAVTVIVGYDAGRWKETLAGKTP